MSSGRDCVPEASREAVFLRPGRIEGEGVSGGTSFDAGELGEDGGTEDAAVDIDTLDPPDDE